MKGIIGKPYIDLSAEVNLSELIDFEPQILKALSLCDKKSSNFGPGVLKEKNESLVCDSIYLRESLSFEKKNHNESCHDHISNWEKLSFLRPWFNQLPFDSIGRVLFFVTQGQGRGPIHRDYFHDREPHKNEFIYVQLANKKLFLFDEVTGESVEILSRASFFNERDYHYTEQINGEGVALRIDGVFNSSLKEKIGIMAHEMFK